MISSKKTKTELISEVEKLQHKIELLESQKDSKKNNQPVSHLKDPDFLSFLSRSKNFFVLVDRNRNILDINKLGKEINREDIIGSNVFLLVTDESKQAMKQAIDLAFETSEPQSYDSSRVMGNGELCFFFNTVTPIYENNEIIAVIVEATDVTAEVKIKNELKVSEEKFKRLAENATDVVYKYSIFPEYKNEYISPSVEAITGYTPAEFYADPDLAFRIIHPDDLQFADNQRKESRNSTLLNNNERKIQAFRWIRKDGAIIWIETISTPVFNTAGQLIAVEGISREITERKKYEQNLIQSEKQYKDLIAGSTELMQVVDVVGNFLYVNPTWKETLGYNEKEIAKLNLSDIIEKDFLEPCMAKFMQVLNGEKLKNIQVVFKTKAGHQLFLEGNAEPKYADGKLIGTHAFFKNVTDRKKTEQQLLESEYKYRTLVEVSKDAIIVNQGGFVKYVNPAALKLFGAKNAEQLIGKLTIGLFHPDYHKMILETVKTIWSTNSSCAAMDEKIIQLNGKVVDVEVVATPFLLLGEQAIHIVIREISERKQNENRIKEREQDIFLARHAELVPGLIFQYQVFPDGRFMFPFASNKIWEIFEVTPDEVKDDASLAFNRLYSEDSESVVSSIRDSMKTLMDWDYEFKVNLPVKGKRWLSGHAKPEQLTDGSVVWHGYISDITERKIIVEQINQSLQEKEVLLKEVHHRVKNNLQVISSILNLQSSYVKDEATVNVLRESQNRIKSMAFIHESLYQANDFSSINFSDYVINLLQNLMQSYSKLNQTVKLNVDLQTIFLNLDSAIPCGLVINEIISNALKYAFVVNKEGDEITITMQMEDENIRLVIGDNGVGLPKNIDYRNTESLGLQLVVTLVGQLNGSLDLDNTNGTKYTIVFAK